MVEQKEEFIDISPETGGSRGKKSTVFQETEWNMILQNPQGLTKEGMQESLKLWKLSSNKHVQILFETMMARCQKVSPSGISPDGKIILAKKDGIITWVKDDPNYVSKTKVK